ncbi:hypothetical protein V1L54_27035 [Streptomyces sp. TRM 70361]|uniref:hypothetical protein n=1 Tax=Streptomyces sp. TRM 70361 TaxID=3116553 RepID=UPI002E7B3B32|nr:hypothetical protein [Streptomyces sp. TRM 70361]MEE1943017.1 hypothetical protein [Streptomyces sp. TRM 70361]
MAMKFFRRRSSPPPSSPGHPADLHAAASTGAVPQQCPNCGSPKLFRKKASFTATYRIDGKRSVSQPFTPMQVHCRKCDFLVNDDLYGDAQVVYARLAERAGGRTPQVRVAAEVNKATQAAKQLPALSDAERDQDYDRVREAWGCAGMHTIAENELQDTVTRIIRGYLAEGAYEVETETLEQRILMLSFYTATGWRPVRLARTASSGFVVYGQIQLYRILDAL